MVLECSYRCSQMLQCLAKKKMLPLEMGRNLEWAEQQMKTNNGEASEKEAHDSSRERISQKKDTNHKAVYSYTIENNI